MNGNPKENIGWDACIFLSWISQKPRINPDDLVAVNEQAHKILDHKAMLTTSIISLCEVLEGDLEEEKKRTLSEFFKRRNVNLAPVNIRVAMIAKEIREYYRNQRPDKNSPCLSTPDALQLAAAIWGKCDVFYTFDGEGKKPRGYPLLPLNGKLAEKYELKIEKPKPSVRPLFLFSDDDEFPPRL